MKCKSRLKRFVFLAAYGSCFDLQVVITKPTMSISSVVVIDHPADVSGIVPEVAKSLRVIMRLSVVLMNLVAQPGSEQSEAFADIS